VGHVDYSGSDAMLICGSAAKVICGSAAKVVCGAAAIQRITGNLITGNFKC
jgi:hypothetical protein